MPQTTIAAFMLALAVVFGAFGAHGLRDMLDAYSLGVYEKGVLYHFFHALGMLAVPLSVKAGLVKASAAKWAFVLLLTGIVFFSGSLYVLAISGQKFLGAITPIGGVAFIAGWMVLAWGAMQAPSST
jgi:uncharacterized membrane protein YgdD (TMEM256/DUF423 family)